MYSSHNTPYEKVGKNEPVSIADEVPFEIPESWEWVRASSLGQMVRGKGIKRTETIPDGMPCVRYGEIYTTYNTSFTNTKSFIPQQLYSQCNLFHTGDLIYTLTGENKPDIAKTVAYLGGSPVAAGGDMAYWTYHKMNPLYLVYFMESPYCIEQKRRLATGDIIVHISTDKVGSFLVPVPPKAEQDRIVAKLQEIKPLLQEYDRKEQKIHLEQKLFPEQLKKSILQMAVQGKLVPQNPSDEPASVLLERIRIEKERLIAEGKIKRDKNESVILRRDNSHYEKQGKFEICIDTKIPFEIPETWCWIRWGSLSESIQYGYNAPAQNTGRIKMVRISDIQNGQVLWGSVPYCNISEIDIETYLLKKNDILFARTGGTVGKSYLVQDVPEEAIYAGYLIRTRYSTSLCAQYLKYFMESPLYWTQLKEGTTATAQPNCNGKTLGRMLIPVPPAAEQRRIVNTLNKIFSRVSAL